MAAGFLSRRLLFAGCVALAGTAEAQEASDPRAFVAGLYRAHMPSVTGRAPGVPLDRRLRERFFAPDLAAAIGRDLAEAERNGDVPRMNFDPITASQDPEVRDLTIRTLSQDGNQARVEAVFRQWGRVTQVLFTLRQGRGGWMVWDIGANDRAGGLRALYGLR